MYKLSTAILAFAILVLIKIITNTGDYIGSLQSQIHDRDVALDIVAHAVNTQQGMLDNQSRHIAILETGLGQCMRACPAPSPKNRP